MLFLWRDFSEVKAVKQAAVSLRTPRRIAFLLNLLPWRQGCCSNGGKKKFDTIPNTKDTKGYILAVRSQGFSEAL